MIKETQIVPVHKVDTSLPSDGDVYEYTESQEQKTKDLEQMKKAYHKMMDGPAGEIIRTFYSDVDIIFVPDIGFYYALQKHEVHVDVRWLFGDFLSRFPEDQRQTMFIWAHLHELSHTIEYIKDPEGSLESFERNRNIAKDLAKKVYDYWQTERGDEITDALKSKITITDPETGKAEQIPMAEIQLRRAITKHLNRMYNIFEDIYVNTLVARRVPKFYSSLDTDSPIISPGAEVVQTLYRDMLFKIEGDDYRDAPEFLQMIDPLLRDYMLGTETKIDEGVRKRRDAACGKYGFTVEQVIQSLAIERDIKKRSAMIQMFFEPLFHELLVEDFKNAPLPQEEDSQQQGDRTQQQDSGDPSSENDASSEGQDGDNKQDQDTQDQDSDAQSQDTQEQDGNAQNKDDQSQKQDDASQSGDSESEENDSQSGADQSSQSKSGGKSGGDLDEQQGDYDPFSEYTGPMDRVNPDQVPEETLQDELKREKERREQAKERSEQTAQEREAEIQAEKDAKFAREHNLTPRQMRVFNEIIQAVDQYSDDFKAFIYSLLRRWGKSKGVPPVKSDPKKSGLLSPAHLAPGMARIRAGNSPDMFFRYHKGYDQVPYPEKVVLRFVIDGSGSTQGERYDTQMKAVVALCYACIKVNEERHLRGGEARTVFPTSIIEFSDTVSERKSMTRGNFDTLKSDADKAGLVRFANTAPSNGGTNITGALQHVLSDVSKDVGRRKKEKKEKSVLELVVFLTDGGGQDNPRKAYKVVSDIVAQGAHVIALQFGNPSEEEKGYFSAAFLERDGVSALRVTDLSALPGELQKAVKKAIDSASH